MIFAVVGVIVGRIPLGVILSAALLLVTLATAMPSSEAFGGRRIHTERGGGYVLGRRRLAEPTERLGLRPGPTDGVRKWCGRTPLLAEAC